MSIEKYEEKLIKIISKHLPECKIYLYGSRARKNHTPGSDIDIAIDCSKEIPITIIGNIKEKIAKKIASHIPKYVHLMQNLLKITEKDFL